MGYWFVKFSEENVCYLILKDFWYLLKDLSI